MTEQASFAHRIPEILQLLVTTCVALLFAFSGVRFRRFFSSAVCFSLVALFISPELSLLQCWPLSVSFPILKHGPVLHTVLVAGMAILGVGLGILSLYVPEVPVYVAGVAGNALGCMVLYRLCLWPMVYRLTNLNIDINCWPSRIVGGALGAACVYFFGPYALLTGTALLGSAFLCRRLECAFELYLDFYQITRSDSTHLSLILPLVVLAPAVLALAMGVQLWLGNHRRTCKQVREQRKARDLAGASFVLP